MTHEVCQINKKVQMIYGDIAEVHSSDPHNSGRQADRSNSRSPCPTAPAVRAQLNHEDRMSVDGQVAPNGRILLARPARFGWRLLMRTTGRLTGYSAATGGRRWRDRAARPACRPERRRRWRRDLQRRSRQLRRLNDLFVPKAD